MARLLIVLAPIAVAVALLTGFGHGRKAHPAAPAIEKGQQIPGATPSVGTAAPDPEQAALAGVDAFHLRFKDAPRSGIVFDVKSGEVLWRHNPVKRTQIASLTKIMTALLVVENTTSRDQFRIPKDALNYTGSGVGLLPKGRHVTVEALLHGLLLPSGNDAAHALADKVSGSSRSFVMAMNAQAQEMSLGCTHYTSPDGFIDAGNHSCAIDLAALARAVLDQPRLAKIVGSRSAVLKFPTKGGKLYLFNNNPLLRTGYPGTIGVKTGYTDAAGRCLVAAVRRNGHRLGVVLLHSYDPGTQARKLLDRGFRAMRRG
jgi:D-alanyl-D-alanine carboxypeptidase